LPWLFASTSIPVRVIMVLTPLCERGIVEKKYPHGPIYVPAKIDEAGEPLDFRLGFMERAGT
jgi:hypothetical protein